MKLKMCSVFDRYRRRSYDFMYPNRTMCDVLEAMRGCYKTRNFAYLSGLIEEVQDMANRMESALSDKADVRSYKDERSELHEEIKKLREQKKALEKEVKKDA